MCEMKNVAIRDSGRLSVCQCICSGNMAERIEVLRGVETLGDPRNIVLDWSPTYPRGFDAAVSRLVCRVIPTVVRMTSTVFYQFTAFC